MAGWCRTTLLSIGSTLVGLAWAAPVAGHDGPRGPEPAATRPAVIAGRVTYRGPVPPPVPVPEAFSVRQVMEVAAGSGALKDAVVWLDQGRKLAQDGGDGRQAKPAIMDQREFRFLPHVLAIRAGQRVLFTNSDAANHGVMATSLQPANSFNVVTGTGGSYLHRFAATKWPVMITCPMHSGMKAWIAVFEHPYYGVTDKAGRFRLPPVPPGRYRLLVRHYEGLLRRELPVVVAPGQQLHLEIHFVRDRLPPELTRRPAEP